MRSRRRRPGRTRRAGLRRPGLAQRGRRRRSQRAGRRGCGSPRTARRRRYRGMRPWRAKPRERRRGVHPDVPDGMRLLHQAGVRLVTLTNGSADLAAGTFARAGVLDLLERRMSVSEPRRWRPTSQAYPFAATVCGVPIDQMALVAVHPWDIDGAKRAGMTTPWLDRAGSPYPDPFLPADVTGPHGCRGRTAGAVSSDREATPAQHSLPSGDIPRSIGVMGRRGN